MKMTAARFAGVAVLLVILCLTLCAQQNQLAAKAQAAYDKKAFADGAPLFLLAAQVDPRNAFTHLYNATCCYALSGQKDLALSSLEIAIAKGWRDKKHTEEDEDLASLRGDPRWNDVLSKVTTGGVEANRDAVINDLNNLSAFAYQYRIRPKSMGGGQGSYVGFKIPERMVTNSNASYEVLEAKDSIVKYKATSVNGFGTVEARIDESGRLSGWRYTGAFAARTPTAQSPVVSNRDALINDINNLAAMAYQYRIRPSSMGGGNGEYTGLKMPEKMQLNENGSFTYTVVGPNEVKIKAVSAKVKGAAIETMLDGDGRLKLWTYWGEFQ
ncbi:MAG: hypothetical protein NTU47_04685 [Ignavibacteriales bacterium]|nr:hypothetical protein [Ignavibacteriales bacterium]